VAYHLWDEIGVTHHLYMDIYIYVDDDDDGDDDDDDEI
jgi:hypothetical protein